MEWLIFIVLIIGLALFLLRGKTVVSHDYPYDKLSTLFSAAERSFYGVLCQATEGKAIVFGKVRVGDVLKTKKGLNASERQKAFNRISAKHFDFVLCKPDDLSVMATVELDDLSHNSKKRMERDEFLEGACEAAQLKLHRFKARNSYNIAEVRGALFPPPITDVGSPSPEQKIEPTFSQQRSDYEPNFEKKLCPKCSSELVRKVARKGEHKGSQFLACSAFPKCRYIAKQNA